MTAFAIGEWLNRVDMRLMSRRCPRCPVFAMQHALRTSPTESAPPFSIAAHAARIARPPVVLLIFAVFFEKV